MALYMLAMHQPVGPAPGPEVLGKVMADLDAIREELQAQGSWVFAGGLHDPDASTVLRPEDGEVVVTDGPYAEGKEHLGGITVIDVPDLDAALEWGRRTALASTLPIEVRPFRERF
ncbi:MAG TPA: YciI family protein [Blastococcus sp.]|nr:YciI family protein [Blastococcus sp.]